MGRPVGVIDTGPASPRLNLAYGQALVEAHRAGTVGDAVRFIRFPRAAIVGRHQRLAREVDTGWCRANGVEIARRITGGGAIWMEPSVLGWELVLDRRAVSPDLAGASARICAGVARGLATLGVDARFRPRNDVEVGGRKLCGTGGFFDGRTLLYQGTVLVDLDAEAMASALLLPGAKLARRGLNLLADRVTTLRALLGEAPPLERVEAALLAGWAAELGIEPAPVPPPAGLDAAARAIHDAEIGTDAFVDPPEPPAGPPWRSAEHAAPGGTVRAHLRLRPGDDAVVQDVAFEGDFFVTPPRAVADLEAALRDLPVAAAGRAVEAFFAASPATSMLGLTPADFARALELAATG